MDTAPLTLRLDQLPLWRLLVALSDAERVAGSNSPTARALAREINRRLAGPIPADTAEDTAKGGRPNG
jgi:hypothetical protein